MTTALRLKEAFEQSDPSTVVFGLNKRLMAQAKRGADGSAIEDILTEETVNLHVRALLDNKIQGQSMIPALGRALDNTDLAMSNIALIGGMGGDNMSNKALHALYSLQDEGFDISHAMPLFEKLHPRSFIELEEKVNVERGQAPERDNTGPAIKNTVL